MSEVIEFPKGEKSLSPLIGPFSYNAVVVEGRRIPLLTGFREGDDMTALVVDGRFSTSVPNDKAYEVAWLLAQAIAVASGYSHLGAETKDHSFAPICSQIGGPAHD